MATYVTFKLCTFGYLGSVRDRTDGFEPIINGFYIGFKMNSSLHIKSNLELDLKFDLF